MKIINSINIGIITGLFCVWAALSPLTVNAQHFGHGGGGGGGFHPSGGGGGARPAGGGGGFHPAPSGGGGGFRPAPSGGGVRPSGGGEVHPGAINGGSRNFGFHIFGGNRGGDRPPIAVHNNEPVFHHEGFSGYHPYSYHPYHPYYWGPRWHPFGFFLGALTADAILLSVAGSDYYYDNGVYYAPYNGGYQAVAPPIGAVVSYLPAGFETIPLDDEDTYYYYGGVFYVSQGGSYRVVPAPVGAVVTQIPEGATEQSINGENYLLYNNTYYLPVSSNGQDAYQVVQVN